MFTAENDLERSLIKASTDPAHRPQFYHDFIASDIYVITPGAVPTKAGATTVAPGTELQLSMIDHGGTRCIAVFSSLTRLQAVIQSEVGYLQTNAGALLGMVKDTPLVLNPGSDYGKVFTPEEIAGIVNGTLGQPTVHTVEGSTQVLLGQPRDYPQSLVSTLVRLFKGLSEVQSAYLAQIHDTSRSDPPHTLIGISVTGAWDKVVAQTGLVAQGIDFPNPPLDIIQMGKMPLAEGSVESYLLNTKPFYTRSWVGGLLRGKR